MTEEEDIVYSCYRLDCTKLNSEVNIKNHYKNDVIYRILNYKAKSTNIVDEYRSVIFSAPENKLLCFSPPRSIRYEKFRDDNHDIEDKIIVNEIIEGVMVNLFYDDRLRSWEIATKSAIGGNYCYQGKTEKKTFQQMFLDVFRCDKKQGINDIAFFENLSRNYCYSFVLQHPCNKILTPVTDKKLYLVAVYDIHDDCRATYIPPTIYEEWSVFENVVGIINFPERYDFTNFSVLERDVASEQNSPFSIGKMIHNIETGERAYLKNPSRIKAQKNGNAQCYYQYLCICRTNKVFDFLQYYPQIKSEFRSFGLEYEAFIRGVYNSYVDYYIARTGSTISEKFFPHIKMIHKTIYLPSIKHGKRRINKTAVKQYFDKMEPRELLYHLNYDRRLLSL
jgi:hypothetical protein